ncbi:phenylalanyl-tRNA synthetase beta subunit [Chitinophaga terrae (ex Kim and Jung 2007)]|uniref:Phenylalanine--tRNA ligase beta subunit n=1 Tax=Chitinophaga terrae (ex Kim and Jung 2007) TaxID=408074 RepID=A0A1H4FDS8_9BACT|nr:phenylalanine--tRNA ligase subunit beta [Chitinophaga terrae (ex Kim and Jung 2007)]GEP92443.1 phenylalanine--tRNA ligase beta subunit [Chitinophaga terrae (ex Kim and Jung 2007)]SEA94908.1 phenylalanyl-tRNA synthetase beta subunit [Chitinophaga terrae (ex Kim and Jung 2007)]
MTISYNWLCDYLPVKPTPEELSTILTRIGLEVESLEKFEAVKGSLAGLVIGEVLTAEKHPNADKLKLTTVNIGSGEPLHIVCGAPNVAAGQKVVVAPIGTTIYPISGEPLTMKKAKIRGEESQGMICAEDEIGLGSSHAGIMVLDPSLQPGTPASEVFKPAQDHIFEIGLTPNRMDAMSHIGVARDVCAFLNNLENTGKYQVQLPAINALPKAGTQLPVSVKIENTDACPRYTGVSITGVKVAPSPDWLKNKLTAIGVRPINNIVDITNFILHETGQPLHAFDATAIKGNEVVVKNLPQDTLFTTLDGKERKLDASDLMICNGAGEGMCIAGVFGGLHSGVTDTTQQIFLESAFFSAGGIRTTSFRHGLRTDAATRFEKGVDISNVLFALQRAADLICQLGGGKIASEIVDVYPVVKPKTHVSVTYNYIRKLSGGNYSDEKIKNILSSLGFEILSANAEGLEVAVPFSKPDISLPADIVEEVMRIDGLDNIEIPSKITISPALSAQPDPEQVKEKIADYLASNGFNEIFTNSITNSKYYPEEVLAHTVKMMNSLTVELDIMRPSMLETGLESIAHNLNRKNENLLFFEFGKTYAALEKGYGEFNHLALYLTGTKTDETWIHKSSNVDFYFLKGYVINILRQLGYQQLTWTESEDAGLQPGWEIKVKNQPVVKLGGVKPAKLKQFDIKQPVWFAVFDWDKLLQLLKKTDSFYKEIPRFPAVRRDLALVLDKQVNFAAVEAAVRGVKSPLLQGINLFDVFESEKLGANKKSYAVSFTFLDPQKTLTDKEIDAVMEKLIKAFETQLQAEIRK